MQYTHLDGQQKLQDAVSPASKCRGFQVRAQLGGVQVRVDGPSSCLYNTGAGVVLSMI